MSKLSRKMTAELNAQMGREFSASNQYLAMAGVRVELHDRDRLHRRFSDLPAGLAVYVRRVPE